MPQTVEIPDRGVAEFPDDFTPDQIKGVIKQKFYATPQPTPAAPSEQGGIIQSVVSEAKTLAGQALGAVNPINLIQGALDIHPRSGLQEVMRTGRILRDIVGGAGIQETIRKEAPEIAQQQEAILGQHGPEAQRETLSGIGTQLGMVAAPFIHGKTIPMREVAFGKAEPATPMEAAVEPVPAVETPVAEPVPAPEAAPVTPAAEPFPSISRSAEEARRVERVAEPVAEPVPEDVAPVTAEPIQETPQLEIKPVEEVTPSASQEPIAESVTQPEVRTQVGEEAPLRQQGAATETRQGIEERAKAPEDVITWADEGGNKFNVFRENVHTKVEPDPEGNVRLRGVVVRQGERGKGIGRDFVEQLIEGARERFPDANEAVVWAFPAEQGFWKKVGFELTGKTADAGEVGQVAELRRSLRETAQTQPDIVPTVPTREAGPTTTEIPSTAQKPSKIGQSIEAKAVEAKLTQGFAETAGYDPITIADQSNRATTLVRDNLPLSRSIVRGEAPLPAGLRGTPLLTALEEHLVRNPDPRLAYELANSPLTSATSAAAQELRLMAERVPDSIAAKFQEIREARRAGPKLRGETPESVTAEIHKEVLKQTSKRPTWEQFVREIVC